MCKRSYSDIYYSRISSGKFKSFPVKWRYDYNGGHYNLILDDYGSEYLSLGLTFSPFFEGETHVLSYDPLCGHNFHGKFDSSSSATSYCLKYLHLSPHRMYSKWSFNGVLRNDDVAYVSSFDIKKSNGNSRKRKRR